MLTTKNIIKTKTNKRQRRKTIPDECITLEQYKNILGRVCETIMLDDDELSQKNIIRVALRYNISNKLIAQMINYLLPNAKATSGSVASMIKFMRNQEIKLQEFKDLLEQDDQV